MKISTAKVCRPSCALFLACFGLGLIGCGSTRDALGEGRQPISAAPDDGENAGDAEACGAGVPLANGGGPSCQVVARGLCFATARAACACAGCDADECAIQESFPAQAACPSSDGVGPNPDGSVSDGNSGSGTSDEPGASGGSNASPGAGSEPHLGAGCDDSVTSPPEACGAGVVRGEGGSQRCDFVVNGLCFGDSDTACACAGCEANACVILESSPAMIRCQ